MSYTALYRKYRPSIFDDVIGQSHITQTLTNQIKNDMVGHAYLFTGSRGTGKTSCAKIFAKAVNCLSPKNGSPCGECAVCRSLDDPGNIDVLEIDAASNNKVDEIRELRERIKYPPVVGRRKVYIIDEVHMLTDSAFNALLKTLEEPPSHALFILATTEVHKLPATILSRCMRFDFRLVSSDELYTHVKKIYDAEGKKYEDEACRYIAAAGEGSVRDSLSIADMCFARSESTLTLAEVQDVLGAADRTKIKGLFQAIAENNVGKVLEEINILAGLGKSMSVIAKDLIAYVRDVLAVKSGMEKLVVDTKENLAALREFADSYGVELLAAIIQILSAAEQDLRYAVSPKIVLECTSLRACRLISVDYSVLEARIAALERSKVNYVAPVNAPPQRVASGEKAVQNTDSSGGDAGEKTNAESVQESAVKSDSRRDLPGGAKAVWGRIISHMRSNESMSLYSLCGAHSDYEIAGDKLIIWTASGVEYLQFSDESALSAITRALNAEGKHLEVTVEKRKGVADMDSEIDNLKKLAGNAPINIKK